MAEAGAPAARCRLYLSAPAALPTDFATTLAAVLAVGEVACLRLSPGPDIRPLVDLAQAHACAVVLDGRPDLVGDLSADGVHLGNPADYENARRLLGTAASIGVFCDSSRHLAMEASEAGADYVAFAPDLDLVTWWAELMVVPVVVELGNDLDRAADYIAASADFICLGEALWHDREGAAAAVRRLARLMG
jgi:thiamine-phosphate pyrophosphorylase